MEELPSFANINFNGEVVKATRANTIVYQHLGKNALYDHIFITHDDEKYGAYVWANQPPENPQFEPLLEVAVEAECEIHANIQRVSPGDVKAFGKAAMRDLINFDGVPEGWE